MGERERDIIIYTDMKQLIKVSVAVMTMLLSGWLPSRGVDIKIGDLSYSIISSIECTVRVSSCDKSCETCDIPSTIKIDGTEYIVRELGSLAFYENSRLAVVNIPNSITFIRAGAFFGCSRLTSVNMADSVNEIEGGAFEGCSALTNVTIPKSVTYIESSAFNECTRLTEINVASGNEHYSSENGVLYSKSGDKLIRYPQGKQEMAFNISNSVTRIQEGAFEGCSALSEVTIPNSVRYIGTKAFANCTGLTHVTIPDLVTDINPYTFIGCWKLTNVTIPNSVTYIGSSAFKYCYGLTSINIPNSVKYIKEGVFECCSGLTSVTIPGSVKNIGRESFTGCTGLKAVYCQWEEPIEGDTRLFEDYTYDNAVLYVPNGCESRYESMEPWKSFVNINGYELMGIEDVTPDFGTDEYVVYNLRGVLMLKTTDIENVRKLPGGVYIVNGRKLMLK